MGGSSASPLHAVRLDLKVQCRPALSDTMYSVQKYICVSIAPKSYQEQWTSFLCPQCHVSYNSNESALSVVECIAVKNFQIYFER